MRIGKSILFIFISLMMTGCGSTSKEENSIHEADELFRRQKEILKAYTDSFNKGKDSLDRERLMAELEEKLYQSTADLSPYSASGLDKDQNDTLYAMTLVLIKASDPKVTTDSIVSDSIPAPRK